MPLFADLLSNGLGILLTITADTNFVPSHKPLRTCVKLCYSSTFIVVSFEINFA